MPNDNEYTAEEQALAEAAMNDTESGYISPEDAAQMTDEEVTHVTDAVNNMLSNGLTVEEQKRIEDILNEEKPQNYEELFQELKSDEVAKLKFCRVMKIDSEKLDELINMSPSEWEMTTGMKTMLRTDIRNTNADGKGLDDLDWPAKKEDYPPKSIELKDINGKVTGTISAGTGKGHDTNKNWAHYSGELGEFDYDTRYFEICQRDVDMNDPSKGYITFLHATEKSGGYDDATKYITYQDGEKGLQIADYLFADSDNVTKAGTLPDSIISAHGMYANCKKLENITADQDSKDSFLFINAGEVYNKFPPNLEDASGMFYKCQNIAWDGFNEKMPESLVDARSMFNGCAKLENCPDFSNCEYLSPNLMAGIYNDTQLVTVEKEEDPEKPGEMQNVVKLKDSAENSMPKYWQDAKHKNALMESKGFEGVNFEHIQGDREKYSEALVLSATSDYAQAVYAEVQNSVSAGTHGLADAGVYTDEKGNTYSGVTELNEIKDNEKDPISNFFSKFGMNFSGVGGIGSHIVGGLGDYALVRAVTGSKVIGIVGALGLQAVGATQNSATPILSMVTKMLPEDNSFRKMVEDLNANFHESEEDIDASNYKANLTASIVNTSKSLDYGTIRSAAGPEVMSKLSQEMVQNGTLATLADRSNEDLKQVHNTMATTLDTCLASFKGGDITTPETNAMTKEYLSNVVSSMKYYQAGVYDHSIGLVDRDKCFAGAQKYVTAMEVPLYDHIIKAQEDSKVMGSPMFSDKEWNDLCQQTESIGEISLKDYYDNYYQTGKSYINEFYVTEMRPEELAQASMDDYDPAYSIDDTTGQTTAKPSKKLTDSSQPNPHSQSTQRSATLPSAQPSQNFTKTMTRADKVAAAERLSDGIEDTTGQEFSRETDEYTHGGSSSF